MFKTKKEKLGYKHLEISWSGVPVADLSVGDHFPFITTGKHGSLLTRSTPWEWAVMDDAWDGGFLAAFELNKEGW